MKKKYKTKFPVARIKKIMQLDEDVGKVAQATPILICMLCLGTFYAILIDQACNQARQRSSKQLTVAHLKKTIDTIEQFDFLKDIVASVPDPTDTVMTEEKDDKPVRTRKPKSIKMKEEDED
ncbi:unnamed protein product [Cunninghamella echinulata]